jgi:hypothetical protein
MPDKARKCCPRACGAGDMGVKNQYDGGGGRECRTPSVQCHSQGSKLGRTGGPAAVFAAGEAGRGYVGLQVTIFKFRVLRPWDRHQSRYKEGVGWEGGGGAATTQLLCIGDSIKTLQVSTRVSTAHSEGGGDEQERRGGVVAGMATPRRAPLRAPLPGRPRRQQGCRKSAGHGRQQCGREAWVQAPPEGGDEQVLQRERDRRGNTSPTERFGRGARHDPIVASKSSFPCRQPCTRPPEGGSRAAQALGVPMGGDWWSQLHGPEFARKISVDAVSRNAWTEVSVSIQWLGTPGPLRFLPMKNVSRTFSQ